MKKLLVLAAALAVALTVFSFPIAALADETPTPTATDVSPVPTDVVGDDEGLDANDFIYLEPDFYPNYDAADAAADDVAPKTGDFSMLPQIMMAAASVGALAFAAKRAK